MTFNVEEKHAAGGALAAMSVPTTVNAVGMDNLLVELADAVFEGDRETASTVTGAGFGAIGLALMAAAMVGPFDDTWGIIMIGAGAGSIGVAFEAFMEGR